MDPKTFFAPFYDGKDLMHDLGHIERVLLQARQMPEFIDCDQELLLYGAYLHGVDEVDLSVIETGLRKEGFSEERISQFFTCGRESLKDSVPQTLEGKILHDAHLLEGGECYGIIKSLITGSLRSQSLHETLQYYETNLAWKFKCYLPNNQEKLSKREKFADTVIKSLKAHI